MSPKAKTPRKKAAATSKRSLAAKIAAATRKHRAAGKKAAKTRVRKVAAKKAAKTRVRKVAAKKAAATRASKKQAASAPPAATYTVGNAEITEISPNAPAAFTMDVPGREPDSPDTGKPQLVLATRGKERNMRTHITTLKKGITRTPEFKKKGLAGFAVNVGTKCGHGCVYCSTGAVLRMHDSFKQAGESPFALGYAIVDPDTPVRVAHDAMGMRKRGLIQLCTTVDAWSPEAQQYGLGRKCLEAILAQRNWKVRVLTKNAAAVDDFDLIKKYRDRVLVGLSLTGTRQNGKLLSVIEPNASPIADRMEVYKKAKRQGLRVYGMLCPLMPWLDKDQIDSLIRFVLDHGAEEIFVEPVNPRGPFLKATEQALRDAGYADEADVLAVVQQKEGWSSYTRWLLETVQASLRRHRALPKLRFLLYPSWLTLADKRWIKQHPSGVKWLAKKKKKKQEVAA
jgi:DNA repair photolyase